STEFKTNYTPRGARGESPSCDAKTARPGRETPRETPKAGGSQAVAARKGAEAERNGLESLCWDEHLQGRNGQRCGSRGDSSADQGERVGVQGEVSGFGRCIVRQHGGINGQGS